MKTMMLISIMCLMSFSNYAQQRDKNQSAVNKKNKCLKDPNMPANAKLAWPSSGYLPTQDPACAPCYTYTSKHGTDIMECPYLNFLPEPKEGRVQSANVTYPTANGIADGLTIQRENTYTGEYPKTCQRDPHMPANAKPSWPKSPYFSLVAPQCAPCYTYVNKHGLAIMECPGLIFLPEAKK